MPPEPNLGSPETFQFARYNLRLRAVEVPLGISICHLLVFAWSICSDVHGSELLEKDMRTLVEVQLSSFLLKVAFKNIVILCYFSRGLYLSSSKRRVYHFLDGEKDFPGTGFLLEFPSLPSVVQFSKTPPKTCHQQFFGRQDVDFVRRALVVNVVR